MIPDDDHCRISNLPIHLIDNILDRMLICDAARTSILSRTWRNIWETHPNILLERQFIKQLISSVEDIESAQRQYLRVVNSILLSHVGAILKFSLYIPASSNLGDTPYPCLWIKQLAEKGVKNLDLRNKLPYPTNKMPSYFFSCSDLTKLCLENWELNPPHTFRVFRNLTSISLRIVVFTCNMSFGPQVRHFELNYCAGIEHLDIQLTNHGKNIEYFFIKRSVEMEERHAVGDLKKSFNLRRLLGNMSSIKFLQVDPISLSFLDPGLTFHNHLTSPMENLKRLILYNVAFNDVYVISNALCLLRSMPILKRLEIKVGPDMNCGRNVEFKAEHYLESLDCVDLTLNRLRKVSMHNILGSRAELLLIKLLLASSPSLRRMELKHNTEVVDSTEYLRIEQESLQFPRKSPVVKISWRS